MQIEDFRNAVEQIGLFPLMAGLKHHLYLTDGNGRRADLTVQKILATHGGPKPSEYSETVTESNDAFGSGVWAGPTRDGSHFHFRSDPWGADSQVMVITRRFAYDRKTCQIIPCSGDCSIYHGSCGCDSYHDNNGRDYDGDYVAEDGCREGACDACLRPGPQCETHDTIHPDFY